MAWDPTEDSAKLAWMRAGGVVSAEWQIDGEGRHVLKSCTVGPVPTNDTEERKPRKVTPDEVEKRRRDVLLASGSRLVARPRDPAA